VTQLPDDDRLRERFRELRGETTLSGSVPDFDAMLVRARAEAAARPSFGVMDGGATADGVGVRAERRFLRAGAWASAALAATVAGLLLTDRRPSDDDDFARLVAAYATDASGGAWRSPTSGLLAVPGMELTRSVPSIGAPVRGLDPSTLPAPEAAPPEENL
jgi:hypothetical protein